MQEFKRQLRARFGPPLQSLGYATGVMQFSAHLQHTTGAIILMYHSVADNTMTEWIDPRNHVPADVFEKQMTFLVNNRRVVSLDDLIALLRRGETPEKGTVVITFDDGYLDNLTVAAPILDRHGLPATLYLATGYIDRGEAQWVDQAYTAFKFRTKHKLEWGENEPAVFDLDDPVQFVAGHQVVCASLLSVSAVGRRVLLDELHKQLQPSQEPSRLTMNWDEVQILLRKHKCFQIGSHTLEHIDMTNISENEARQELIDSIQRITGATGISPRHFSFPYGRTSAHLRQLVAETGIESACGGEGIDPVVNLGNDPYRLPRVEAPPSMHRFDLLTDAANTGIWRRLGR